jgi:transposase
MGRLPEAWIAPPATRELRKLVRHRAKLVGLRAHGKAEVHAVLAKCGVQVGMSDLFGLEGTALLDRLSLPAPYQARVRSLRRVIDALNFEIDVFAGMCRARLARDPGYAALQTIPGIGGVLAAVFLAEIGDVHRFPGPAQLASWAGLTPKHRESDTHVHRGRITKQGSRLIRWAAVESVQILSKTSQVGALGDGSGPAAAATSPWSPRPAANSSTFTTRCATTRCGPCTPVHAAPPSRHEPHTETDRRGSRRS